MTVLAWLRNLPWRPAHDIAVDQSGSEGEMALNRIAFCFVVGGYMLLVMPAGSVAIEQTLFYVALSVAFFIHIRAYPEPNGVRRGAALLTDVGFLSLTLYAGGEHAAILWPIYLWATLGNGFRFGVAWLYGAMALSGACFSAVILLTPFWQGQTHLATGLLLGIVAVPLYAATLIKKLSSARREAEAANAAKSIFLAGVSHELRTPLNAIIGMGTMLRTTTLDHEQRDMVRTVDGAARSLLAQIEGILDFASIEAGATPVQVEAVELEHLLGEVDRLLASQAAEKGIELSFHLTPRVPLRIQADPRHLTGILLNLGANALKFTEFGGVVIAVDAVPLEAGGHRLRFEVSDTGIGIPLEAQSRIFESFAQADPDTLHRYGGTGLGLAICRRLVLAMGGDIGVQSRPGEGSTFWFEFDGGASATDALDPGPATLLMMTMRGSDGTALAERLGAAGHRIQACDTTEAVMAELRRLPLQERRALLIVGAGPPPGFRAPHSLPVILATHEAPPGLPPVLIRRLCRVRVSAEADDRELRAALFAALGPAQAPDARQPIPLSAAPRRVLVVDDNQMNRRVLGTILERAGHRVLLATNGEEALDILEGSGVDCVLMDLNMPGMGGVEVVKLHRFAALGRRPVPIVALTADATSDAPQRCLEAGFDAFLLKPVEPRILLELVDRLSAQAEASSDRPASTPETVKVAAISEHPRYRAGGGGAALDPQVIGRLLDLGGAEFVAELAEDFLTDALAQLDGMVAAAAARDILAFRAAAHGIRSIAANLGARAVEESCQAAESLPPEEFTAAHATPALAARIRTEIERVRQSLPDTKGGERHGNTA
ncbi:hybrid sensor histidine kinase/response regulator [Plastoroseomonas arctica]|uniref:histidine kinase n=1 Tax=Plastoroseomonas arctica TaxID=1509237 RepID=A0AAF1KKN9_9PROT|nr:ATP-binding protein [Plastoroseomonas arctica]MBR0653756.1 response regulator [Plastoroseomonas arctica]